MLLRFKGSQQFRQRLVFATLSGRPIRIDDIRSRDASPGLRDYEASLLRLLEKLTNGCAVEINETGGRARRRAPFLAAGWCPVAPSRFARKAGVPCLAAARLLPTGGPHACRQNTGQPRPPNVPAGTSLRYRPGVIICGGGLSHDCPASRSIGYFLEPLVLLALFAKKVGGRGADGGRKPHRPAAWGSARGRGGACTQTTRQTVLGAKPPPPALPPPSGPSPPPPASRCP
jgi:hypothetical protein